MREGRIDGSHEDRPALSSVRDLPCAAVRGSAMETLAFLRAAAGPQNTTGLEDAWVQKSPSAASLFL